MLINRIPATTAVAISCLVWATDVSAQARLTFASTLPDANPLVTEVFVPWVQEVNAMAEGQFIIQLENGPALANAVNVFERTEAGIVDMGWGLLGSVRAPFPRTLIGALPFLIEDSVSGSDALWALYKDGTLAPDFHNIHMVALVATPPSGLHSNRPVATLEDMSGTRVRAVDRISSLLAAELGATAISIPAPDMYQAVETSVVDSILTGWPGVVLFRLQEVTSEHLDANLGAIPAGIFMNPASYAGLSERGREILGQAGDNLVRMLGEWYDEMNGIYRDRVAALPGHSIRTLSDEEEARWREAADRVIEVVVAETPDGAAILDAFRAQLGQQ